MPWTGLQLCIWSGPELVDILGVFPGNDSSVYHLSACLETVSRVDIVWDKYLTNSLKQSMVERTVALRRDNACLKERLFRRTGRLS